MKSSFRLNAMLLMFTVHYVVINSVTLNETVATAIYWHLLLQTVG